MMCFILRRKIGTTMNLQFTVQMHTKPYAAGGCEEIKLRHTSMFSEHQEDSVYYFPPSIFRRT